jgi:hypothetical protein
MAAPRASDPVEEVTAALQGAREARTLHLAPDLLDRLRELSPAELLLVNSRPPSSGSGRHDALAAVIELLRLDCGVSLPPWCSGSVAPPRGSPLPSACRHTLAT